MNLLLNINAICRKTTVLGPGNRYVVWVQGCGKRCNGCLTVDALDMNDKILLEPEKLSNDILSVNDIEGVTISGGEPFLQAKAVNELIMQIKAKKNLTFIVYSGYMYDELLKMNCDVKKMLSLIDVLIDGEYIASLNDDRGLRGSSNQTVHFFNDAFRKMESVFIDSIREVELKKNMLIGIKPKNFDDFFINVIKSSK